MEAKLFYDDDLDALRATVQALGGYKTVGVKLYPDRTPDSAGRLVADCCNPSRSERFKPSQLLLIMKMGREQGCHILAEHFMGEAGYAKPVPLDPQDEKAALVRHMDEVLATASQLAVRLERIRRMS